MGAAIYCRKSNDDERSAADGKSVERQLELARKFCGDHGWSVASEFVDDGISGGEFHNRPGLDALRAAAGRRQQPFDTLVVMALSRLGRDRDRVGTVLTELHEAGVAVYEYQTGQEVKLGTATERFVASVTAFGDEHYLEGIAKNTAEGLRRKAKHGHFTGQRTYGYTSVQVGEHYEAHRPRRVSRGPARVRPVRRGRGRRQDRRAVERRQDPLAGRQGSEAHQAGQGDGEGQGHVR